MRRYHDRVRCELPQVASPTGPIDGHDERPRAKAREGELLAHGEGEQQRGLPPFARNGLASCAYTFEVYDMPVIRRVVLSKKAEKDLATVRRTLR
jgi:hypothetical protein